MGNIRTCPFLKKNNTPGNARTYPADLKDGPDCKRVGVYDAQVQEMRLEDDGEKHEHDEEPRRRMVELVIPFPIARKHSGQGIYANLGEYQEGKQTVPLLSCPRPPF